MRHIQAVSLLLGLVACAHGITIDTVIVGDAGNANDPATGGLYGGVNYEYRIGKFEVTAGQYVSFLNAVAATDTYGLYDTEMETVTVLASIARSGMPGEYSYSAIGSPNRPISFVSWGAAARFANWLHNGQPAGPQNASTTEDGAYTLNGAVKTSQLLAVTRNADAKWFIPSESEWYKAAFYQPASKGGDADGYWNYPMRTNDQPYSDSPPGTTPDNSRVANFAFNDGVNNGYDNGVVFKGTTIHRLSQVGAYNLSSSYYGTFDQGGNVYEWNESISTVGSLTERGQRGGSYQSGPEILAATFRGLGSTALGSPFGGFRVAALIPEPDTYGTLLVGLCGMLLCIRHS